MKGVAVRLAGLLAAVGVMGIAMPADADDCVPGLPSTAIELLASSYPNHRIVQLSDLNVDDQGIWKNAYHNACPGVVEGNFTGKRHEYAVLLVSVKDDQREIKAVLLQPEEGGGITQRKLYTERRVGNPPVIRRSQPGVYKDSEDHTKLNALNDVVLVEQLESKVTAIAIVRGEIRVLRIAD
jgi:hypothetical protein